MDLTDLEELAYRSILRTSMYEYCSSVQDVAENLAISVNSAKGVIGSLIKKGMIYTQEETRDRVIFNDVFAWFHMRGTYCSPSYGNENLLDHEREAIENYLK